MSVDVVDFPSNQTVPMFASAAPASPKTASQFANPQRNHPANPARGLTRVICVLLAATCLLPQSIGSACPFCSAVSQTIRQETAAMDAVVIASAAQSDITRNPETGLIRMKVENVIRGEKHVRVGDFVEAVYFGKVEMGRRFLLSGIEPPKLEWSAMPVSKRAEKYIADALALKDNALERLKFYHEYLEDEEEFISRDAYDEFASAPYEAIQELKPFMNHDQLVEWLQEPNMGPDRKRLYFTMLGVCGSDADLPMLEKMLRAPKKSMTSGLDALVACYLTLAGEKGLPLITEVFLADKTAPFSHAYAAIMAIRFHGTEGDVIARSALVEALHHVLERKELADMVIPDLAKWNDWSQVDRLVTMFRESDAENNWVRVPIINYLRACPLPKAAEAIEELKKLDPESVRRASVFFPQPVPLRDKESSSSSIERKSTTKLAGIPSGDVPSVQPDASNRTGAVRIRAVHGDRYADAQIAGVLTDSASNSAGVSNSSNPWRLGNVLALILSTIVIGQYLLLSGGPAGREYDTVAIDSATGESAV